VKNGPALDGYHTLGRIVSSGKRGKVLAALQRVLGVVQMIEKPCAGENGTPVKEEYGQKDTLVSVYDYELGLPNSVTAPKCRCDIPLNSRTLFLSIG
jgi:hypothetical protein